MQILMIVAKERLPTANDLITQVRVLFPPKVSVTKVWVVGGGEDGGLTLHLVCRLVRMVVAMVMIRVVMIMIVVVDGGLTLYVVCRLVLGLIGWLAEMPLLVWLIGSLVWVRLARKGLTLASGGKDKRK